MKMSKITLVPMGGLANRIRALLSGYALSEAVGADYRVVWLKDEGLNARFEDLFEPSPYVAIEEGNFVDKLRYTPPLKRNLYVPALYQHLSNDVVMYDWNMGHLLGNNEAMEKSVEGRVSLIGSGLGFYDYDAGLFAKLFIPRKELQDRVKENIRRMRKNWIGVHIRRTDNARSIEESPLECFVQKMREWGDVDFYLATDDEKVKRSLSNEFPGRVFTSDKEAERGTLEGMREAVVEMYTLMESHYFLGSFYSSFSDIVLDSGCRGEIVTRQ